MDLDSMFLQISSDVQKGLSYQVMRKKYPLMTRYLYRKLGGMRSRQRELPENNAVMLVTGGKVHDPSDIGGWDRDLLVGSLMGDGTLESVADDTCLFREAHCWRQIPYLSMKWNLLIPHSSGVTVRAPHGGLSDYSVCLTTVSSRSLQPYKELFYTARVDGKGNLQKNTLTEDVIDAMTPRALAFWVMDDGKRYGSVRGCTCLTVAVQPYHELSKVERLAGMLSDRVGIRFHGAQYGRVVEFRTHAESLCATLDVLAPHILPMFAYKLNLKEHEVGSALREGEWYKAWEGRKHRAQHPFLESHSYQEYRGSTDDLFRARYFKALMSRTLVRGFPYPRLDSDGLEHAWQSIRSANVVEKEGQLSCHPKVNAFPSSFMPHRYRLAHKVRMSPYEVYADPRQLRKVLQRQLVSGPAIEQTNIRNAICVYGTTALGQFNTGVARHLVERYCPEDGVVLDPCAGWGNRLCGTVACGRSYHGVEPSAETCRALEAISAWILGQTGRDCVQVVNSVAEDPKSYRGRLFDFALTSPPYFDVEDYGSDEGQSSKRFSNYDKWLAGFLGPMFRNVYGHLRPGSRFCVNIANVLGYPLESDTLTAAGTAGFKLESSLRMPGYRRPGMAHRVSEPLFVFIKGGSDGQ